MKLSRRPKDCSRFYLETYRDDRNSFRSVYYHGSAKTPKEETTLAKHTRQKDAKMLDYHKDTQESGRITR